MKQKPRKFTNGFYPTSETELEEMADKERDNFDNQDTVQRLSQILTDLRCTDKLSSEEESDMIGVVRDEVESEEFLLRTLYTSVDTVKIYSVSQWSKHKVNRELKQYKELLAEMETHEEIIKMLNNICEHCVTKDNNKAEEDVDDEFNLHDSVKEVQTLLYQLWLRLLEWECLLEQHHLGPLDKAEEVVTDCNDDSIFRDRNVSTERTDSCTFPSSSPSPSSTSSSSSPSPTSYTCDSPAISKTEQSDSDSGVSDLSSDISFYKARKVSPVKSPAKLSKQKGETGRKHRATPTTRPSPPQSPESIDTHHSKDDSLLYWIKWILLIFLMFLLILTVLVLYQVKCYNNICAISLDTKIHYYKYSSPI